MQLKYYFIISFFVCFSFIELGAQFKIEWIKEKLPESRDSLFIQQVLKNKLLNLYYEGFLLSSIDSFLIQNDTLSMLINFGNKYSNVIIRNNSINELFIKKNERVGSISFSHSEDIARFINKRLNTNEKIGYPFSFIYLNNWEIKQDTLYASMNYWKGPYTIFDSLILSDKGIVRYYVISRYTGISKGEVYNHQLFQNMDELLNSSPYVSLIQPSKLFFKPQKADIYIFPKKKSTSTFDALVAMGGDEDQTKLIFTGHINMSLINRMAFGESMKLKWQRMINNTQELNSEVVLPYLFKSIVGIDASMDLFKADSLYLNTMPTIGLRVYGIGVNYSRIFFQEATSILLTNSVNQWNPYVHRNIGFNVHWQRLDQFFLPRKGYLLDATLKYGNHKIEIQPIKANLTSEFLEGSMEFNHYKSIGSLFVIKSDVRMLWMNKFNIKLGDSNVLYRYSLNEMSRIGGVNSLRGFDEQSIYTNSYGLIGEEIRFMLDANSALFAFWNAAWYQANTISYINESFLHGIGAGIFLTTNGGLFQLSYAIGKFGGENFNTGSSKIHISYISRF